MTDEERNEKIHKILKYIAVDMVLDYRTQKEESEWQYAELKHIEFNEYVTRGLFQILFEDKICTDVRP